MLTYAIADFSHLLSILILLQKMKSSSARFKPLRVGSFIANCEAERIGHLFQIAIPLPNRLRNPLSRPPLDLLQSG